MSTGCLHAFSRREEKDGRRVLSGRPGNWHHPAIAVAGAHARSKVHPQALSNGISFQQGLPASVFHRESLVETLELARALVRPRGPPACLIVNMMPCSLLPAP